MIRFHSRFAGLGIAVIIMIALIGYDLRARRAFGLTPTPQPALILDRSEIDLGRVIAGQVVRTSVRVTNTGPEPLVIGDLEAGCSCVARLGDLKPLLPGESRDIVVELSTKDLVAGSLTRRVTFTLNGKPQGKYAINLKAALEQEFDVSLALIDFSAASRSGDRREIEIVARRSGVVFEGISTTNDAVDVKLQRRSGQRATAVATLRANSEPGEHYGVLIIATSSEFNPQIRIPVFATIKKR